MASPTAERYPDETTLKHDALRFLSVDNFLGIIRRSKVLTSQQKSTLRGQALHGDLEAAYVGYQILMDEERRR